MCDHCGCDQPASHQHDVPKNSRSIELAEDVLAHDRAHAESLRHKLAAHGSRLVNIIGSPGCGKTELLTALIPKLDSSLRCVVVEGDLATDNDAARIRTTGAPVHQIQTGTACHLTAHDVEHALMHLPTLQDKTLVLVENVGNLVCPSMFDLGESLRLVCLSVTEGADKPQKYPVSFREAGLVVITKCDLLEHVDFDLEACLSMINDIKPGARTLVTSARSQTNIAQLAEQLLALWS